MAREIDVKQLSAASYAALLNPDYASAVSFE
jgi:hypothetical protein